MPVQYQVAGAASMRACVWASGGKVVGLLVTSPQVGVQSPALAVMEVVPMARSEVPAPMAARASAAVAALLSACPMAEMAVE